MKKITIPSTVLLLVAMIICIGCNAPTKNDDNTLLERTNNDSNLPIIENDSEIGFTNNAVKVISSDGDGSNKMTWDRILDYTPIGHKKIKGFNICIEYAKVHSLNTCTLSVYSFNSGVATIVQEIPLTTTRGIQLRPRTITESGKKTTEIRVYEINDVKHYNDPISHPISSKDFDGKICINPGIGGSDPAPFFIGVDDIRGNGICKLGAIAVSLARNSDVKIMYEPVANKLTVSGQYFEPEKTTWCSLDNRIPYWSCGFTKGTCTDANGCN